MQVSNSGGDVLARTGMVICDLSDMNPAKSYVLEVPIPMDINATMVSWGKRVTSKDKYITVASDSCNLPWIRTPKCSRERPQRIHSETNFCSSFGQPLGQSIFVCCVWLKLFVFSIHILCQPCTSMPRRGWTDVPTEWVQIGRGHRPKSEQWPLAPRHSARRSEATRPGQGRLSQPVNRPHTKVHSLEAALEALGPRIRRRRRRFKQLCREPRQPQHQHSEFSGRVEESQRSCAGTTSQEAGFIERSQKRVAAETALLEDARQQLARLEQRVAAVPMVSEAAAGVANMDLLRAKLAEAEAERDELRGRK